jgi:hypothetical protein
VYGFIYCLFFLCDVEDVPFEVGQEQTFEEIEPQFLGEEGKWISSPYLLFFS